MLIFFYINDCEVEMTLVYNVASGILFILFIITGFLKENVTFTILCFLGMLACVFMANLKHIRKVTASATGFSLEARDVIEKATVTISEMQKLAKLVSRVALTQVKRTGRLGGVPDEEAENIKESFLTLLDELNLSPEDKKYVLKDYNKFVLHDFAIVLLGGCRCAPSSWPEEDRAKCKEMRASLLEKLPSPKEIEELLKRNNSLSETHKEILKDYEYFLTNKQYRRPEFIAKYRELYSSLSL
jgi:hypothetical protein